MTTKDEPIDAGEAVMPLIVPVDTRLDVVDR